MARRPTPRPRDKAEDFMMERESRRLERLDDGPSGAEMELGPLSAPSRSLRPQLRPKRFEEGGKVNGFPDLNDDGKVTKADILKGRGVKGFEKGGMVVSRAQLSGTKFSGTF